MKLLIAIIFSALLSANAFAYPIDGWYWNPAESGRGLNIEMQDNVIFLSLFHYDADGRPAWWISNGEYDSSTGVLEGEFIITRNGQCPGCPWREPDYDFTSGGTYTLTFDTWGSAFLEWQGGTTRLIRTYWAFDFNQPQTFLLGDFHFTDGALGVYFGERLRFDREMSDDNGQFVAGRRIDGSQARIAVGLYDEEQEKFAILLDSSSNFYRLYIFDMAKDRIVGRSWSYRKSEDPTGSGLPSVAHRTASRTSAQTGSGPKLLSKSPNEDIDYYRNEQDMLRSHLQDAIADRQSDSGVESEGLFADSASLSDQFQRLRDALISLNTEGRLSE